MAPERRRPVTFTATHARAFLGSDVTVTVTAGSGESLADISVQLDGIWLEELELNGGTERYERSFSGVGTSSPGAEHELIVTARDAAGGVHGATTRWTDS